MRNARARAPVAAPAFAKGRRARPKAEGDGPEPSPARARRLARDLGSWFALAARDLPWRRDRRPYAVWISEIMLQQTRVETVVPYFERFLGDFPDVAALAAAPLDAVLARWAGLGYYRRARVLHLAAREVTERFAGELPGDVDRLQSLPGIGRYTAGAIASLAFGRRAPLVDGNVARVLARLFDIAVDAKTPRGARVFWELAERLLPEDAPGRFNEALMELGATVCTPREPRCEACPLSRHCEARKTGRQRELPVVAKRAARPEVALVALVVRAGARVLLARRPPDGLFGGLWEPPMLEATPRAAVATLRAAGLSVTATRCGRVRHVLSHRELAVEVLRADVERNEEHAEHAVVLPGYEAAGWHRAAAPGVGTSSLARKVLRAALGEV